VLGYVVSYEYKLWVLTVTVIPYICNAPMFLIVVTRKRGRAQRRAALRGPCVTVAT